MKIPKLCLLERVATKDPSRLVLANPFLDLTEGKKPVLVASNGHALVQIPVEVDDDDTAGPVSIASLREARKLGGRREALAQVECQAKALVVAGGMSFPRPDFSPPTNWRKCIHTGPPAFTFAIDAQLLADMQSAFGAGSVLITLEGPEQAISVKPHGGMKGEQTPAAPGASGVLMPMRTCHALPRPRAAGGGK